MAAVPRGTTRWETALITGGTTGIGAALARLLADRGTRIAVCARRTDLLDEAKRMLGPNAVTIRADLSDPERAASIVSEAEEKIGGPLDLVIANAGFGITRHGARLRPDDVTPVLLLNAVGACATLAAAIPKMVSRGRGHLVGISSIAAYRGLPTSAAYCASKAALSTFLASIRADLLSSGVKVTDVRPGFVDTPLTQKNKFKMPFLLTADEAGRRILRALERNRRVYTFPWQTAIGVRLLTLVPTALYDRIASRVPIKGSRGPGNP